MFNLFKKLYDKLFCDHVFKFVRNIYGDEALHTPGKSVKRSVWKCHKCGKIEYREELHNGGGFFC